MKLSNKLPIVLMLITLLLLFVIPANASYNEENPIADTYIDESYPDSNYGSNSKIRVASNAKILLKFDLSTYASKDIAYARLKIYNEGGSNYAGVEVLVYRIVEDWNESDVTWNNAPAYDDTEVVASFTLSSGWIEINMTDEVQYLVDHPEENHGWVLVWNSSSSGYALIRSREYNGFEPTLEIYYIDGSSATVTTTVTSTTTEIVTETATQTTTVTETQANATITQTTTITQPATTQTVTTTIYSTKTLTQPSSIDTSSTMSLISSILPILLLVGIIGAMAKAVSRG